MAIENFTKTKAAIKIYEDLTQEEYDALAKEPHSFYLVNGVGIYKGTTLISAGANSSMDEIVEELNQAIAAKQDTLVSGTNIKTINGESILGEGNIEVAASDDGVDTAYVENEVLYIDDDTSAGGNASLTEDDVNNIISSNETVVTLTNDVRDLQTDKQDILESGTNIKTINNQSILGSGNIEIQGGSQETIDITTWLSNQTTNGFEGSVPQEYRDIERLKKALLSGTIGEHKYIFRFIEIFQDTEYNFLFIKNNALENLATVDITINIETWAIRLDCYTYQPKLESGVNIKTINNQSILGSGNITIEGGGLKVVDVVELTGEQIDTVETPITVQLNETRFNELINADILNVYNSNGASIFLYKDGKSISYPDFGITNMVSFKSENISLVNGTANFTAWSITFMSGVEGGATLYQLEYNFTGIYKFSMSKS